jgi:hypothetical protein
MVLWYYGIMVLWYCGIVVLWYCGIMVLWYYGIVVCYGVHLTYQFTKILIYYNTINTNLR